MKCFNQLQTTSDQTINWVFQISNYAYDIKYTGLPQANSTYNEIQINNNELPDIFHKSVWVGG